MSRIIDRIAAATRARVSEAKRRLPEAAIRDRALAVRPHGGFGAGLAGGDRIRVIAEIKAASPSAGTIRPGLDPEDLAARLAGAGATALSILTEPEFFGGDPRYLAAARRGAPDRPLLRKDFVLERWQVWESRLLGADAVLLIAALLPATELQDLLQAADDAGLDALVETKSVAELDRAAAIGARLIGINARDLDDFSVDLERAKRLAGRLPAGAIAVAESGVSGAADLQTLQRAGFAAALVGTHLMRADDPGAELAAWLAAVAPAGAGR